LPNLIDRLITRVDLIRQKSADKFGLPAHNMYRVLRSWSGGQVGDGTPTVTETLLTPTPHVKFGGKDKLLPIGREDDRKMVATEISLTFQEDFFTGGTLPVGQEIFYKLVERNGQGAATTYWILDRTPEVMRDEVCWKLTFTHYTVCP